MGVKQRWTIYGKKKKSVNGREGGHKTDIYIQQPHTVCIAPNYRHRQTPITRRHAKYGQFTMSGGCKRKCNGNEIKTKICITTSYIFFFICRQAGIKTKSSQQ